jgi:phosphate starvation-inducible PhoH-like protein
VLQGGGKGLTNNELFQDNNAVKPEKSGKIAKSGAMGATVLREPTAESHAVLELGHGAAERLLGSGDGVLFMLEEALDVRLVVRGSSLKIFGEKPLVERATAVLQQLLKLSAGGGEIDSVAVNYQLSLWEQRLSQNNPGDVEQLSQIVYTTPKGKQIRAKSYGQNAYLQAVDKHDITFGIGPAGTGKTYLAVVKAADALKKRRVKKIVLVRPAVEAGEKLGFLPGDLQEKVNPYLRPIYDALDDVLGSETAAKYMERNLIEVVPLAYMRGRTLDSSFIILDEAQNTTPPQMKMFLTRMGMGSKAVVTGDITQIDLPQGQRSGLRDAQNVLRDIPGIAFCYLTDLDVVRHPLVQKIIEAYAAQETELEAKREVRREAECAARHD